MIKQKDSKMVKFWVILGTLVVLLVPIGLLNGVINDREDYNSEAIQNVAKSWGKEQTIYAPTLSYSVLKIKDKDNEKVQELETVYLQLNDYKADIKINTETRKKGIYKVPVYTADVTLSGDFLRGNTNLSDKTLKLSYEVSDTVGMIEEPTVEINNQKPVSTMESRYLFKLNNSSNNIPFKITYKVRGINNIYASINGNRNKVYISGNWENPSFSGSFLPINREIDKQNFSAEWSVPKIATESLTNDSIYNNSSAKIEVSLLTPVDNYRMVNRIFKYAFLFLSLTFLAYFIYEITSKEKKKIHPIQYLMLGGAMLIFYLLLLSTSEFIPFLIAYILSALLIISMIGIYTYKVLSQGQNKTFAIVITTLLGILYSLLYILLSLQDFALLIGSIALFVVMAIIMYITRSVEWYENEAGSSEK